MNKDEVLNFAIITGKIMLENGAETWRVEDTMERLLKSFNLGEPEVFVTTTGLFASIDKTTKLKRVRNRTINLAKVSMTNDLSRKLVDKKINFEEAKIKLQEIKEFKGYSKFTIIFCTSFACLFFSLLYDGHLYDGLTAFFVGMILSVFMNLFKKINLQSFFSSLFGGAIVSISSLILFNLGFGLDIDKIIIGSIMPLAPGLALTNAARDILHGDFISGSGRAFDALISAVAIGTGVGGIISIWTSIFQN